MIDGVRLQEALIFQKTSIEKSLIEKALQFIQFERSLNNFRLEEILVWHSAREGKINDNSDSIKTISSLIDMKLSRGVEAIKALHRDTVLLGQARVEKKNLEQHNKIALNDLKRKTKENIEKAKTASEVLSVKRSINSLDSQFRQTSIEYANAKENNPLIMNQLDQDKAFQYLYRRGFGTENYKGNAIIARMDAWLAEKIDYQKATDLYHSAILLEPKYDDFMLAYESKKTELENNLAIIEQNIVQELDEIRLDFSKQSSEIEDLNKKIKIIREKIQVSKEIIYKIIANNDEDLNKNYEDLFKMHVREKTASEVRLSQTNSPEIIVAKNRAISLSEERIKLSGQVDALRLACSVMFDRITVTNELLHKLKARNWLSSDTTFDLNENSKFFIDITLGDADINVAWDALKESYKPLDEALEIVHQEQVSMKI